MSNAYSLPPMTAQDFLSLDTSGDRVIDSRYANQMSKYLNQAKKGIDVAEKAVLFSSINSFTFDFQSISEILAANPFDETAVRISTAASARQEFSFRNNPFESVAESLELAIAEIFWKQSSDLADLHINMLIIDEKYDQAIKCLYWIAAESDFSFMLLDFFKDLKKADKKAFNLIIEALAEDRVVEAFPFKAESLFEIGDYSKAFWYWSQTLRHINEDLERADQANYLRNMGKCLVALDLHKHAAMARKYFNKAYMFGDLEAGYQRALMERSLNDNSALQFIVNQLLHDLNRDSVSEEFSSKVVALSEGLKRQYH